MTDNERGTWTSASSAEADAACPGRHLAQRDIPEEPRDKDAQRGTRIHDALAGKAVELTHDEADIVESCRNIEAKVVAEYFGPEVAKLNANPIREKRLWLAVNGFRHSGQPDAIYRRGTKALVIDYKSLASDIPRAARNLQTRDYVVLVSVNSLLLDEVACAVIQPLVTHSPQLCVYSKDDILTAFNEVCNRVALSNDPKSPRIAGEAQCHFCKAKLRCLEYQHWASAPMPALISFDVPVESWTPEQRAAAAAALKPAEELLENIKDHLKAMLAKDAASVPGWHLKPGAKRTFITNPQEVFDRFNKVGGSLEQFMGTLTVGKDKLKAHVAGITGAKGKALDAALDTLLDGVVETTQAAPSLARVKEDEK